VHLVREAGWLRLAAGPGDVMDEQPECLWRTIGWGLWWSWCRLRCRLHQHGGFLVVEVGGKPTYAKPGAFCIFCGRQVGQGWPEDLVT
jgi:hypothetical protein